MEQTYDHITPRLAAQRVAVMEVTDGNDGALAAGIDVAAVICLYSRELARWYKQGSLVLNSSQENAHPTIYQGASGREKRSNE